MLPHVVQPLALSLLLGETGVYSNVNQTNPHHGSQVISAGPTSGAKGTLIMVHGRGASAESILSLYEELELPELRAIAPQASGSTWYPLSFLAPVDGNEPYLSSALELIELLVLKELDGKVPAEQIALLGFSQGACLASEFAVRHPRPYAAVIGLTGGLIGPPGTPRDYEGSLSGVRAFFGSGDPDPHVPFSRVTETQAVYERMGAEVEVRRYPGMPHTINSEEIEICRRLLRETIK